MKKEKNRDTFARVFALVAIVISVIAFIPSKPQFTLNNPKIFLDTVDGNKQSMKVEAEMRNNGQRTATDILVRYYAVFEDECKNLIVLGPSDVNVPSAFPPQTSDFYRSPGIDWTNGLPKNPSYLVFVVNYHDDLPIIRWFETEQSRIYWRWDSKSKGFPLVKDIPQTDKEKLDAAIANPPRTIECNGVKLTAS